MRSALACLFFVLLPASACTAGSGSILEAGPRFPDHEGVVTEISFEQLVLDGDTTLKIREDVESFTSAGHRVTALLTWQNRYVHLGMADGEVKWIAGIGIVRRSDSIVTYSGEFVSMERGRAVFEDGTVGLLA